MAGKAGGFSRGAKTDRLLFQHVGERHSVQTQEAELQFLPARGGVRGNGNGNQPEADGPLPDGTHMKNRDGNQPARPPWLLYTWQLTELQ